MKYYIKVTNDVVIIKDGNTEKKYYWEEGNRFDNINKPNDKEEVSDEEEVSDLGKTIALVCFLLFSLLYLWAVYQL